MWHMDGHMGSSAMLAFARLGASINAESAVAAPRKEQRSGVFASYPLRGVAYNCSLAMGHGKRAWWVWAVAGRGWRAGPGASRRTAVSMSGDVRRCGVRPSCDLDQRQSEERVVWSLGLSE